MPGTYLLTGLTIVSLLPPCEQGPCSLVYSQHENTIWKVVGVKYIFVKWTLPMWRPCQLFYYKLMRSSWHLGQFLLTPYQNTPYFKVWMDRSCRRVLISLVLRKIPCYPWVVGIDVKQDGERSRDLLSLPTELVPNSPDLILLREEPWDRSHFLIKCEWFCF